MPRLALGIGCVALVTSFALQPAASLQAAGEPAHPITSVPRLSGELSGALEDRKFAEAIRLIDDELKKPSAPHADYLLYLRGRAQSELKLYDLAIETFRRLPAEYPKSEWISRARFGQAEVLARQRNYQLAGEIYEREAGRLLSAGRRDELAAIYLEFADRFFDGFADPSAPVKRRTTIVRLRSFINRRRRCIPVWKSGSKSSCGSHGAGTNSTNCRPRSTPIANGSRNTAAMRMSKTARR